MKAVKRMSEMTWKEYEAQKDQILILPIGSTEQHGPHLPLSVDTVIAEEFAKLLAKEVNGVCAPAVPYGYKSKPLSGGGPLFPGTIDLNGNTLQNLLIDLFLEFAADGYRKIFVMNAHFENDPFIAEAMDIAAKQLGGSVHFVLSNWWDPISDKAIAEIFDTIPFPGWALEHAAVTETSLMMYFAPELVRVEEIVDVSPVQTSAYVEYPVRKGKIHESGVLATARSSSAKKGELIVGYVLPELKNIAESVFNK